MANVQLATYGGYSMAVARMMQANTATSGTLQTEPKNIGWGTGPDTALVTDVALSVPSLTEARVSGTSSQVTTTTGGDTYQVVGVLTSTAIQTITNVGLFDTATAAAQTTVTTGSNSIISSSTNTNCYVTSASGFPSTGQYLIQVGPEVMLVTGGQGTTTWTVTRAVNGSGSPAGTGIATLSSGNAVVFGGFPGGVNTGFTGLAGTSPGTAAYGGSMFAKANFTGLALNIGDSISFTMSAVYS